MTPFLDNTYILLYHNSRAVGQYRVRDLGLYGIRLESGKVAFPEYSGVEVQFLDNDEDNHWGNTRFPAIVSSSSNDGLELAVQTSKSSILIKWLDAIKKAITLEQ